MLDRALLLWDVISVTAVVVVIFLGVIFAVGLPVSLVRRIPSIYVCCHPKFVLGSIRLPFDAVFVRLPVDLGV